MNARRAAAPALAAIAALACQNSPKSPGPGSGSGDGVDAGVADNGGMAACTPGIRWTPGKKAFREAPQTSASPRSARAAPASPRETSTATATRT